MVGQRADVCRHAEALNIRGCDASYLRQDGHSTCDHVTVLEVAHAQHTIDAFTNEINQPITLAHVELNIGIFCEEIRQARQHEMTCERAVDVDTQQPLRLGASKCRLD